MERPVAYMGVNEDLCRDEREYQKSGVNIVNVNHSISLSVPC